MNHRQTRRTFLGQLSALGLAGMVSRTSRASEAQPNIVLILSDDMGYSDLGCYGSEIATPNLDLLAAEGIRFSRFHSCNMCVPSRASLLTGCYDKSSLRGGHINDRNATLPEVLRGAGYATAMVGKWHLGDGGRGQHPCQRGFDHFYGTLMGANSYFQPFSLMRDNESAETDFADPEFYYTDAISENAVRYIEETPPEKPLFLYVAYTAAHWPLHALPEDMAMYRGKYAMGWDALRDRRLARMKELGVIPPEAVLSPRNPNVPAWDEVDDKPWQERRMEVYAAQIDRMDQGIGRILDALRANNRQENTLVCFMIDNGGCHVEYTPDREGEFLPETTRDGRPMRPGNVSGLMPGAEDTFASYGHGWANASNTPFRFFKQYSHWGGIRTPLIARWPRGIQRKGAVVDDVAHLIDIMPTCLELAGARLPEGKYPLDGRSLAPLFQGAARQPHDRLFWDWAQGAAILEGDWKLVRIKNEAWELYNVAEDPVELTDLAEAHPERVKALAAAWQEWNDTRKKMD